jgi:hypothetical protein
VSNFKLKWTAIATNGAVRQSKIIGTTGPHTVYVTYGMPTVGITDLRMDHAIEMTEGKGNDPHCLIQRLMTMFPKYGPTQYLDDEGVGDDREVWEISGAFINGKCEIAECQAIVRYVKALIQTVGLPGSADAKAFAIYSDPEDAQNAIYEGELSILGHKGSTAYTTVDHWEANLIDGAGLPNSFEAALKYTYNNITRYYPGGLGGRTFLDKNELLKCVFIAIGYFEWDEEEQTNTIKQIVDRYTCTISYPVPAPDPRNMCNP